ncbi:MAG TPA: phosphoribosylanthranilate isomerase [Pyrinomonadaceae bacterium]|jgi:phosphoribosylanthranilate isomerase|nr:phosphoribosylanthranilate isomerase [Pyrinomonadaceae bacterium]
MTFIKICGITNLDDALAAVDAGADALGFNFYKPSPRYITTDAARAIIDELPESILTVGVFVNEPSPESAETRAREAGITAIQLHGDESPDYCRQLTPRFVIKALAAGADFDTQRANDYDVEAILLDTKDEALRGGTGRTFDWSIAQRVRRTVPKLFLAGGLSLQNIEDAIISVDPYGVDACSALEKAPGLKDHERMRVFVKKIRSVKP